jgi:hypothetical protein
VLLPALLLGALPQLALWFGEGVWRRTADWGKAAAVFAMLAVAALIAWRWGALLFRISERNFWALTGSVVLPVYMLARELVRAVIERALPPERLGAARRLAGLLAGALIALVAGGVALWAGPLPHVVAAPPSLAALPAVLKAALWNGLWVAAVYLALAAPAWAIGEARAGTPEDLPPAPDGEAAWRVAHLSDVHLVGENYGFRLECGRDGPRGNHRFARLLDLLAAEHARQPLDHVLITGDITDAGRNAEFIAFDAALARHPALATRVLIIPGNHDVNIVDRANPARLELPIGAGGALRRVRMLAAMQRAQGSRVHLVDRRARRLGPTLDAWLAEGGRGAALARFADEGGVRAALAARAEWEACFPLVAPPPTPDGLGVLLLDTNAETNFSFTNALGLVAYAQVRAAEIALAAYPGARWLVMLHHHLVEYPQPGAKLADRIGTALVNGHWLLGRLRRHGARLIVLHGHRHRDWVGRCGGLRIISAPSPVMGARDDAPRHVWLQRLAPGTEDGLALLAPERLDIPGA